MMPFDGFTFAYPWLGLCVFMPFIWLYLLPSSKTKRSLYLPFLNRLEEAQSHLNLRVKAPKTSWRFYFFCGLWLLMCLLLMRPIFLLNGAPITKYTQDVMLAIDLSKSMEQKDYTLLNKEEKTTRLEGVKSILKPFIQTRQNNRFGLIVFGTGAYLQMPFSDDMPMLDSFISDLQTEMAGPATAIGDAIGLSIQAFKSSQMKQKILLLLTDGSDTSSQLNAYQSAVMAAASGIQIYTIALGDPNTTSDDKVDIKSLQKIAQVTNGAFFSGEDTASLKEALELFSQLEAAEVELIMPVNHKDFYQWLALFGLILLCGYLTLPKLVKFYFSNKRRPNENNV